LNVYQRLFDAAMRVFEITKVFPKEERYSLVEYDEIIAMLVHVINHANDWAIK